MPRASAGFLRYGKGNPNASRAKRTKFTKRAKNLRLKGGYGAMFIQTGGGIAICLKFDPG
jgi:hypothetical protein